MRTVGYAQTSMRAVAAAADVRIGHLQHYFPSRTELIQAVLRQVSKTSRTLGNACDAVDGNRPLMVSPTTPGFRSNDHPDPRISRVRRAEEGCVNGGSYRYLSRPNVTSFCC
ncbi:TetR family transcriptional regulator [Nocardia sp. NPDC004278]